MRYLLIVALIFVSACGRDTPTAPTVVFVPAPAPAPTPTPAPAPVPTVANYAGAWRGSFIVEQCSATSGSMGDILCSSPHGGYSGGAYQPNTTSAIAIELTQSGNSVSGILTIGQTRGNVDGAVRSDQSLALTGGTISSIGAIVITTTLTNWTSALQSSNRLEGALSFSVRTNIYPGDGSVRARLSNVVR